MEIKRIKRVARVAQGGIHHDQTSKPPIIMPSVTRTIDKTNRIMFSLLLSVYPGGG